MTRVDVLFTVNVQDLKLTKKQNLRAKDANYFYAVFDLSETWNDVTGIKASFTRDDLSFVMPLTKRDDKCLECQIPWEVLQKKGAFYCGIFGGDRIITNAVRVDVAESCPCDGVDPKPPTQDWFTKVEYQLEHITIDESQIETAVNDYLTEHPVTVTETDPTVPEWAKAATKPTYTADEVGAAPEVHSHDDLYYTKTQIDSAGYLTSIPAEYVTETELEAKGYITTIPSNYVTEESLSSKGFLTQNDVPTKVSQLENDSGYQTEEQVVQQIGYALDTVLPNFGDNVVTTTLEQVDARGYATTNYVDNVVSDKVTTEQMNTAIQDALATIVDGEAVSY